MRIEGRTFERLTNALVGAFPSSGRIAELVRFKLNENLEAIVGRDNLRATAFKLIEWAESQNRLGELFAGACEMAPGNSDLLAARDELYAVIPSERSVNVGPVRDGFTALARLLASPAVNRQVQRAAIGFRADFELASHQLDVLRSYKDVHDILHDLQIKCFDQIVLESTFFPDNEVARDNLSQHALFLHLLLDRLREVASRRRIRDEEILWIEQIVAPARDELDHALQQLSLMLLKHATRLLNRVLAVQPSMINSALNRTADGLRLPNLIEALKVLRAQMTGVNVDPADLHYFDEGIERLGTLNYSLDALVKDHHQWQDLDNQLRRIADFLPLDQDELSDSFPLLKSTTQALSGSKTDAWTEIFRTNTDRLEAAITSKDPTRIREWFRRYRSQARDRFYEIDSTLKNQCDQLPGIAAPLDAVLRAVE